MITTGQSERLAGLSTTASTTLATVKSTRRFRIERLEERIAPTQILLQSSGGGSKAGPTTFFFNGPSGGGNGGHGCCDCSCGDP
jgi:hypothetical protein